MKTGICWSNWLTGIEATATTFEVTHMRTDPHLWVIENGHTTKLKLTMSSGFEGCVSSTQTLLKYSRRILSHALRYGSVGWRRGSGYTSSNHSLVAVDSYTILSSSSSTGTAPSGFFFQNQSGLSLRWMLTVSCLKKDKQTDLTTDRISKLTCASMDTK